MGNKKIQKCLIPIFVIYLVVFSLFQGTRVFLYFLWTIMSMLLKGATLTYSRAEKTRDYRRVLRHDHAGSYKAMKAAKAKAKAARR